MGLVLAHGGEFVCVAFRTASSASILTGEQTKVILTCVGLTMALTPSLQKIEEQIGAQDGCEYEEIIGDCYISL